ncbi:ovarian-specific serine/threonine-protein kinase Lok isoform X1 [Drosophila persimilis]|uniref:non-specific serine/threonine protein kinase n=1 Tax=Drosophila pseudoobscura pseudoobscura TaxID=46245 RepID=A0A0R3NUJ5_DROPS|nr:ovarian-specific serine/threonine-protein kinase Lok isoform X1 [Drosophila pseudoobscura]XP_026843231.1 ovarian-specific serine/threonine-protein kinase Lok isoform X1 [Drosophila persimilis]
MARDGTQGGTQGATQSQASNIWTQVESQPMERIVWGRLYGKNIKIKSLGTSSNYRIVYTHSSFSVDLNNDEFKAGRGEANDLVLTLKDLPEKILTRISKVHFIIKRANCELTNPVYIQDLSRNGTFVNNEKIGTNNMRILKNDDVISIAHPTYKAFVFKDLSPNEAIGLPEEITKTYSVNRKLGSGAYGLVRLVYETRTCQQFAMKIVKKNMLAGSARPSTNLSDPERVLNEAKIMKNLTHPCVVRMHDIVDKPDSVYMVLEFMRGGDLLNRIISKKLLSEETSKLYFYQMCHAVKYLHDRGITHRDLKPDNVLLESGDEDTLLKVSDFGLSKFVQKDSVMRTLCGTPLYVAPEVLITGGREAYTRKVDIWSLGVVLFTCLSGTLPFSDEYGSPAAEQIKKGKFAYRHPAWKGISQRAKLLINQMLITDPKKRPSIDDVLQANWLRDTKVLQKAKQLMKLDSMEIDEVENNFLEPPTKRSRR